MVASRDNKKLFVTLFCLISLYITWGMVYLSIKFALEQIPPVMLSGMRFLAAGTILLLFRVLVIKDRALPTKQDIKVITISSTFIIVVMGSFLNIGTQYIASGMVALLLASTPMWMVFAGWLLGYDQKPTKTVVIGLVTGFLGVAMLTLSLNDSSTNLLLGVGALFVAMVGWITGSFYVREHTISLSLMNSLALQMIYGGVVMFIISYLIGDFDGFSYADLSLKVWLSYLHLVFFGSLIGFTCYYWLLLNTSTPIAISYAYAEPVVAIILGALLANEQINSKIIVACIVIIISVFLVTKKNNVNS